MNLTHFKGCANSGEVKTTYRQLCKDNHPDVNPNVDVRIIQDINAQYNYIQKNVISYPIGGVKTSYTNTYSNAANDFARAAQEFQNRANSDNIGRMQREAEQKRKVYADDILKRQREQQEKQKREQEEQTRKYKTREEQFNKEVKDYDLANLIVKGFDVAKQKGFKASSVYFKFIEFINKRGLIADLSHFELIAEGCGYKMGWAKYKYSEYLEELIKEEVNKGFKN